VAASTAGIDWLIVGGKSGPGARPMEKAWVYEVRDQCLANGVAFFFNQWGGLRAVESSMGTNRASSHVSPG
jgi:protein gp37